MNTDTRYTTTVDQHVADHATTGLREMRLVEIRTDLSDYISTVDFGKMSEDDQVQTLAILTDIHTARVALAELDADHRAAAEEWLNEQGEIYYDAYAPHIYIAIRETAETESNA